MGPFLSRVSAGISSHESTKAKGRPRGGGCWGLSQRAMQAPTPDLATTAPHHYPHWPGLKEVLIVEGQLNASSLCPQSPTEVLSSPALVLRHPGRSKQHQGKQGAVPWLWCSLLPTTSQETSPTIALWLTGGGISSLPGKTVRAPGLRKEVGPEQGEVFLVLPHHYCSFWSPTLSPSSKERRRLQGVGKQHPAEPHQIGPQDPTTGCSSKFPPLVWVQVQPTPLGWTFRNFIL